MNHADHWLKYLTAEGIVIAQSRVKGEWGVGMDQRDGTYFHFLAQGTAYFSLDGKPEVQMTAGDVVVLPQGAAHSLRSSSNSKVVSLAEFVKNSQALYSREPDATIVLCGSFEMDRYMLTPAIRSLPSSLHLQADAGSATTPVAEVLKALRSEVEQAKLGSKTVVRNLLSNLFIYILRQWSESEKAEVGSWFFAMQNRQIAKALTGIHQSPDHDWTLDALAREAGLSRSAFSQQFRESVGETPYAYLTRWRLGIAARLLGQTSLTIGEIADKVGYSSEYSFNRAFKQARGRTPTKERERRQSSEGGMPTAPG